MWGVEFDQVAPGSGVSDLGLYLDILQVGAVGGNSFRVVRGVRYHRDLRAHRRVAIQLADYAHSDLIPTQDQEALGRGRLLCRTVAGIRVDRSLVSYPPVTL